MKRVIIPIVIALTFISFVSCNTNKKDKEEANVEMTTLSEKAEEYVPVIAKSGAPIHLTTEEFKRLVVDYDANPNEWKYLGERPCIIDFWATWCPPCKAIAPVLEELAAEYKDDIYIYKVDVDENKELAQAFGIQSIPTLLFVPMDGNPKSEVGAIPKEKLKENIDNFLLK